MKFLVVFAALVAVAVGVPSSWTLNELSDAIENPNMHPAMVPYLKAALDEMMDSLNSGNPMQYIMVELPVVIKYTKEELAEAILDPNTEPAFLPILEEAYEELVQAFFAGVDLKYIEVVFPPGLLKPVLPEEPVISEDVISPVEIPATAASSPLVQIIVNVQKQGQNVADVTFSPVDVDARS